MPKKTFGNRSQPPGGSTSSSDDKISKVDALRGVLAAIIHDYRSASAAENDTLAMRIRILQDQLATLKRRTAAQDHGSKELEWVDIWRPD